MTVPFTGRGISYTCGELLSGMNSDSMSVSLSAPYSSNGPFDFAVHSALPKIASKVAFRSVPSVARSLTEKAFLARIDAREVDAVYLFGETSLRLSRALAKRGIVVIREKINCAKNLAKEILDTECRRLGVVPDHHITDRAIDEEAERLGLASYIFCPNSQVESSVLQYKAHVATSQIIPTSYGFNPIRLRPTGSNLDFPAPVYLFVGTVCIRKGAHLLLDAWARAGIPGTLVLAGRMEETIKELCVDYLTLPSVVHVPYTPSISTLYRSADVFVFPSLEEGGPQVTYEAAHCGLPCVVSPMGAGRIIRHMQEGLIVEPHDRDGWISAMRSLAFDVELRTHLAEKAANRSILFDWLKVGGQRREALLKRLRVQQHD